eukprot:scaffold130357_cov18-Tisochrysis_lutea.AAC.1
MHEVLDSLQRRSKALTPDTKPNSMSDSMSDSRDSSIGDSRCSSADEHEPAWKNQALAPATVARRIEFWAQLGCFTCPEWMTELVLLVPGSGEDER